jgi:hypothetical protein
LRRIFGACVAASAFFVGAAAQAQAPSSDELIVEAGVIALTLLSQNGVPSDLVRNYEAMPAAVRDDPRTIVLYARALLQLARAEDAAAALRRGLTLHPAEARLRAELGAVYFLQKRDEAARLELELALGGDSGQWALSAAERGEVVHFIDALDNRRRWRWRATFAIAPDSNVNAATAAEQVDIFGLPFALASSARRRSGIGADYDLNLSGGIGAPTSRAFWRFQGGVSGVDYSGTAFDQTRLAVQTGPRVTVAPRVVLGLDALAERFFYAGKTYSDSVGLEANVSAAATVRTRINASLSYRDIDETHADERDGGVFGADVGVSHASRPDRLWQFRTFVQRGDLATKDNSYTLFYVSAGQYREVRGVGLYAAPFASYRIHDGDDPLFGVRREDREIGLHLRVTRRSWRLFRATPFAGAQLSVRESANPLYDDVRRSRFEIGLTKTY